MADRFEDKVLEWTQAHGLLAGARRVLLAVSGGADSVAMLRALEALRRAGRLEAGLAVGHVNHHLRGEASDGDEQFVLELAGQLGLAFYSASADVRGYAKEHKLSIETAGRLLRRRELIDMARHAECQAVATAHHLDDQAETLVFRLRRGTSFRGLAGIRPTTELEEMQFVRPLLGVRRGEVLAYLRQSGTRWREDHTNADTEMMRNRIRHLMLPKLQGQAEGDLAELLGQLAAAAGELAERVDRQAATLTMKMQNDQIRLDQAAAAKLSPLVLGEVLRQSLVTLEIGLRDYTQRHYEQMADLIRQGKRTTIHLPAGAELAIRKGQVIISRR